MLTCPQRNRLYVLKGEMAGCCLTPLDLSTLLNCKAGSVARLMSVHAVSTMASDGVNTGDAIKSKV